MQDTMTFTRTFNCAFDLDIYMLSGRSPSSAVSSPSGCHSFMSFRSIDIAKLALLHMEKMHLSPSQSWLFVVMIF